MQELRGRLVPKEHGVSHHHHTSLHHHHQPLYGATNQGFMSDAFDESSELEQEPPFGTAASTSKTKAELPAKVEQQQQQLEDIVEGEKEGEERESWDSKIMFLLATIG